jgi:hypothetical protein
MAPACPGVIDQQRMGALGKPVIRAEVLWADVTGVLDAGGSYQANLAAKCRTSEEPMQGMLTRLSRQGRHGRPMRQWRAREDSRAWHMNRQPEQEQHGHDRDMFIHGSLGLVSPQHVAGLLCSYRVSQERGRVSEPVVCTVTAASIAALVSGDRRGTDSAGDAILPYRVTKVSSGPGNESRSQPRHGGLVKHAYADTNRRSSSPTTVRSSIRRSTTSKTERRLPAT